jgi:glycerophosphoryl diester phosphodiesterase
VTPEDKKDYRLYNLTYEEIQKFDCGLRGHSKFPEQQKVAAYKPLLGDVIDAVEEYIRQQGLPAVRYNIEIKSTPAGDDTNHPKPAVFAKLVYDLIKSKNVLDKCIIQSFDSRSLQAMHELDSAVTIALLVFDLDGFNKNIKRLGFKPDTYSPNFILVNKGLVKKCHQQGIKLIPWTVNDTDKLQKMKDLGVDGVISDFPDRAIQVFRGK